MTTRHDIDILVIGAGPAGIAAAVNASRIGARVLVVDDNPLPGGQIWRGGTDTSPLAKHWLDAFKQSQCAYLPNARIVYQKATGEIAAETETELHLIHWQKVIIATGARELFLPFPGWTLPNVTGVGGIQALVKGGLPISGKRIVVAGSGPLLLATAEYLKAHGAHVLEIVEQATFSRLLQFGIGLVEQPAKLWQLARLQLGLRGIPYRFGAWVTAAERSANGLQVTLKQSAKRWQVACDYLACAFHLIPNVELPLMLGCAVTEGRVQVNDMQESTRRGVYCAGESTGIGGVELSLVEGQTAGYAAAGQTEKAQSLFAERTRLKRFANRLNRAFAPNPALKALAAPDTIVCRCEDVTHEKIGRYHSWREAKLHTRCGMGPCQGRVCGAAISFIHDWQVESGRPPIFPVRLGSLTDQNIISAKD